MADRRIVFFLGAGASFGAGAYATVQGGGRVPIPTQTHFWGTFLRFCRSAKNRRLIQSFLFRYFLGYGRAPSHISRAKRDQLLSSVDVEEVFTFLSERDRAPSSSAQLKVYVRRVWEALTVEIGHVFARFCANSQTRKLYRLFIKNHVRRSDAIVSFNYDTVFEDSLPHARKWSYVGVHESLVGLRIHKPHGSINWQSVDGVVEVAAHGNSSVIVAPTHLKFVSASEQSNDTHGYLDQASALAKIWASMELEMRRATALVFIGYSFPVADLYFASVLRSVLADRDDGAPTVAIVNPDAVAIAERLRRRFPLKSVVTYFDLHQYAIATRKAVAN